MPAPLSTAELSVPAFAGLNDVGQIRVVLPGSGTALTGFALYLLYPNGYSATLTTSLVSIGAVFTPVTVFQFSFSFTASGNYLWILNDTSGGGIWIANTQVGAWSANLDGKISDIKKQRTDIERTYAAVSSLNNRRK